MLELQQFYPVVALLLFAVNADSFDKYKVVETTNGKIRGTLNTTFLNGIPFYSFKGIPYAKPPIGVLRFRAPQPADSWKPATFDANRFGDICIQGQSPFLSTLPASEDCLKLNIFVPANIEHGCKLSVLIFVHGGLFKSGSGDDFMYGPDFIAEKQTILVTLNYRLGALGFLALDSKEISGNMGLKDQQMALKWVYSNIGSFGGDSNRITMIGQSVGGVSATFHILSNESSPYIRHSIPMSGSTANVWAMAKEKNNLKLAYRMAKEIGGTELKSYDELIAFLQQVPAEKLTKYNGDFSPINDLVEIVFGPVVERRDADRPFLLEHPEKLYETTRIDAGTNFLFTICDVESLSLLPKRTPSFFAKLNANFSDHVRLPFRGFTIDYKSDGYRSLANEIREFYFGDKVLNVSLEYDYFKFTSDLNWVYVVDESVRNVSKISNGNTYYAWFAVDSKLNVWKKQKPPFTAAMAKYAGAGHGDDMCYLFKCGIAQTRYDEVVRNKNDKQSKICLQTIEYITTMITNMAKYGNPFIDGFLPVNNGQIPFLTMSNDGLSIGINPRQRTINFWNYIKQKAFQLSCAEQQNNQICSY